MTVNTEGGERQTGRCLFNHNVWLQIAQRLALSERELQIVQAVFDDQHETRIARDLAISPHTVHTHLERLYHKLQVGSRVELVVRIAECHLSLCLEPNSSVPPTCDRYAAGRCPFRS